MLWRTRPASAIAVVALMLVSAACGESNASSESDSITLYTCASDTTVGPVVDSFEKAHPSTKVKLYRAPTGELNARVAGDKRSGGLRADVVWACDPLTMQDYVDQGLVGGWTPETSIPSQYRTKDYVGVALLYLVAVSKKGVAPPKAWSDLAGSAYDGKVAVPDPSVAASALGALGYFSANPEYGVGFYEELKKDGATQVSTPDDVVTGVAEGRYSAGITIANSAYAAKKNGSPIEVTWPSPGAIAVYGPAALAKDTKNAKAAKEFISFIASKSGQELMSKAGSYPTLPGVTGPTKPADAKVVFPDWSKLAADKDAVLAQYQKMFGG
jgi:iron(III) transport system substrate-binding protein